MAEVVATLLDHTRTKPDSSWAVATVEVCEVVGDPCAGLSPGARITAVGARLGLAAPGEGLRLRGAWEASAYGHQLRVEEQEAMGVKSAAQAHRWLERLDGVGPRIAQRLAARFGDGIVEVLSTPPAEGEPDPLLEVDGIGEAAARTIRESWAEIGASGSLEDLRYLDGLGLTRFEVNVVLDLARKRQVEPRALLAEEPYALMTARGFGFKRADVVALKAGVSRHAPARIDAGTLHVALEACDGDTMLPSGRLVRVASDALGVEPALVVEAVGRLVAAGRLVLTQEQDGPRWVHPAELVQAERSIYRLLREAAAGGGA